MTLCIHVERRNSGAHGGCPVQLFSGHRNPPTRGIQGGALASSNLEQVLCQIGRHPFDFLLSERGGYGEEHRARPDYFRVFLNDLTLYSLAPRVSGSSTTKIGA